jgi:hypothetical protein
MKISKVRVQQLGNLFGVQVTGLRRDPELDLPQDLAKAIREHGVQKMVVLGGKELGDLLHCHPNTARRYLRILRRRLLESAAQKLIDEGKEAQG